MLSQLFFCVYMGDDGRNGQMGLNCPSSGSYTGVLSGKFVAGLAMNSGSMFKASHEGGECFFSSGWDPVISLSHNENFGAGSMVAHGMFASPSYMIGSESRGLSSSSHLMHYSSNPHIVGMVQKLGGGSFSKMVSPFGMPGYGQNIATDEACTGLV